MSVRNFKKFEIDHWYIYTGTEREPGWNRDGKMDFVLNHKPVKCVKIGVINDASVFEEDPRGVLWDWEEGFDNWIEIKDPNKSYNLKKDQKIYNKIGNKILKTGTDNFFISDNLSIVSVIGDEAYTYALIEAEEMKKEEKKEIKSVTYKGIKFYEGQEVKIVKKDESRELYWNPKMDKYIGQIGKISGSQKTFRDGFIRYDITFENDVDFFEDNKTWTFNIESLEKVENVKDSVEKLFANYYGQKFMTTPTLDTISSNKLIQLPFAIPSDENISFGKPKKVKFTSPKNSYLKFKKNKWFI